MPRPLPPLKALRAFEVAARQGSFTLAADELCVTPAAVSYQVKLLESYLGVRLFRRNARHLVLSHAGAQIIPEVMEAFRRLSRATESFRQPDGYQILRVSVAPSLVSRWLIPRMNDFRQRHPEIELQIDARERLVDMRREDVDVALRFGTGDYDSCCVDSLPPLTSFPVCSPALADNGPALNTVDDIGAYPLIHVEWRHTRQPVPDWSEWLEKVGGPPVDMDSGSRFGQQSLALDAAVAGQGLALANALLANDDLASGRLIRPLNESVPLEYTYHVTYLPEMAEVRRVAAFRQWVFNEIGMAPA
ncbi:LysR family transcriptional regulator [Tamilnaduibacter salinus]|uniref:LysR family transcriptional regulator n=1 Tax=Tamilnaduibacter salinus TaxID=1484056 RepID=A0A2A2I3I8_9GAMM|nr:transcriptional regulator GcvA [Tamilnaduibacter salinus]PAV26152.1 LysR family transcriptional regulator [Tamilnaduibacter salinus]PVY70044.1 LysR family transcriptional regulator [Tamilnaduibacter salinus]